MGIVSLMSTRLAYLGNIMIPRIMFAEIAIPTASIVLDLQQQTVLYAMKDSSCLAHHVTNNAIDLITT
jgi:hypothetical protein